MSDDFFQAVASVQSQEDLSQFVLALRADLAKNPNEWENTTLDAYLEALAAWIDSMDSFYTNNGISGSDIPCWQKIAEMLLAAKSYE